MKRIIITLLVLFAAISSFAQPTQYPVSQNLGNANTLLNTNNGGLKANHILLSFADTTAANSVAHISFNEGSAIRIGDSIFLRSRGQWVLQTSTATNIPSLPDGLISVQGVGLSDTTVTISPNIVWRRDNINYTQTTSSVFQINKADSGYSRFDLIYIDSLNVIRLIEGVQDTVVVVPPAMPPHGIQVTIVSIIGDVVLTPTPSVSTNYWSPNGNNISSGTAYLGTLNSKTLDFIIAGLIRASLDTIGQMRFYLVNNGNYPHALTFYNNLDATLPSFNLAVNSSYGEISLSANNTGYLNALRIKKANGTDSIVGGAYSDMVLQDYGKLTYKSTSSQNTTFDVFSGNVPQAIIGSAARPGTRFGDSTYHGAGLEVNYTDRGFLPPRLTGVQMNAISSPATGTVVYNTDSLGLCFFNGSVWAKIGSSSGGGSTGDTLFVRTPLKVNSTNDTLYMNQVSDVDSGWVSPDQKAFWDAGGASWGLFGNAGTDSASNFIGTTDVQPLYIGINGDTTAKFGTIRNFQVGIDAVASGYASVAMGDGVFASGNYSFASGFGNYASGATSIAMGISTTASGENAISIGNSGTASGERGLVIGTGMATGTQSSVFAYGTASGEQSTAIGGGEASALNSTVIGLNGLASGELSIAMGGGESRGYKSSVLGSSLITKADNSIAIGYENDTTDTPTPLTPLGTDRLFQIGKGNYTNALTVLRNGNVGIGTTTPIAKLHIASTDTFALVVTGMGNSVVGTDSAVVRDIDGNFKVAAKSSGGGVSTAQLTDSLNARGATYLQINNPSATGSFTLTSTTGGIVNSNVTTTQMNAISSPVAGTQVYNTDYASLMEYSTEWGWTSDNTDWKIRNMIDYSNDFTGPLASGTASLSDGMLTTSVANSGLIDTGQAVTVNRIGLVKLSTGTNASGQARIATGTGTLLQTMSLGGGRIVFETAVNPYILPSAAERYSVLSGFSTTNNNVSISNGVLFVYDSSGVVTGSTASPNWQVCTDSANTRTFSNTGVAVTANTWYNLKIIVNAAGTSVDFYINDALVKTETRTIPILPVGMMTQIFKGGGTTARTLHVDYIRYKQKFTTSR